MFRRAPAAAFLVAGVLAGASALAQTSPAFGPLPASTAPADDMPLADYFGLLLQIAPAAESGARTYVAAVQLRCRHTMGTAELRRAMAEGEGNPTLMGLIRAAHLKDTVTRDRLVAQLPCPLGSTR
ncbi:hypothetical protein C1I89_06330 [Achromobacter pulmonis]|uniref:Uncharacterized protein n=1 Tax=Achromobacter pulmonis TaxID=1389932 RepID=A0A2N8KK97_9BURK|nr:hypothetical protein [Achromobacter pulmonis]PND33871.1 hypothetical protein C1I89_06330 [Achromobacter pulmonis]